MERAMNRIFHLALVGLDLGLVGVIAVALTAEAPELAPPPEPRKEMTRLEVRPAPAVDLDQWVASIRERPLFTPGRRPPAAPPPPAAPEAAVVAHELASRLAGLMIQPNRREALFAAEGQKPVAVGLGDWIEGWQVTAIETDGVMLSGPSGERRLEPTGSEHARSDSSSSGKPGSSGQAAAAAPSPAQLAARLWLSDGSRRQDSTPTLAASRVLPKTRTVVSADGRSHAGL
jgi:hypothetical protein